MRFLFGLLLLSFWFGPALFGPAWADDAPADTASPGRAGWEQRFAKANVAHDGHLTQAEAKDGFALIAKHFDEIDLDHKGYVTENDVRAWRAIRSAVRKQSHPKPDPLKPQHAFRLHLDQPAPPAAIETASVPGRVRIASARVRRVAD
jgi:hypothetical protein